MSFRRIPKEIDPRRPPKRSEPTSESEPRSYGQYAEMTPEEVAKLEETTDEVAREGASETAGADDEARSVKRKVQDREAFEEATDEVSREDGESR